jgi:phosphatidylglycerophosphate synthase
MIFGRPLLERLLLLCTREGVRRFIIETHGAPANEIVRALGSFAGKPEVTLVDDFRHFAAEGDARAAATPAIAFYGNLVLARSQLRRAIEAYAQAPSQRMRIDSTDADRGGAIELGPLATLLSDPATGVGSILTERGFLPFALNGRPQDRQEAELRLARSVRAESVSTDAPLAQMIDRRLSWRISYPLARLGVAPNFVTLANTALGVFCAFLFASTGYWSQLAGAILFLASITIDGVDGELARLRMVESETGARLDVFTDNLVHVAIFIGLLIGCYRVSHDRAYFWLLGLLLGGFGACAIAVNRALESAGDEAERWIRMIEQATGRDFAYLLVVLAVFGKLSWFAWGAAFGVWIFAGVLWLLTNRRSGRYRTGASKAG